jgi:hypothetical protein
VGTATFQTVEGLNRALRKLPKLATVQLRDASQDIARDVAGIASSRAAGAGRGWSLLGPTIRAGRDRVPVIRSGGSRRIPGRKGSRQVVGELLYGTEFGGRRQPRTRQFLPHLGTRGYVLYPTIRGEDANIDRRYSAALRDALNLVR